MSALQSTAVRHLHRNTVGAAWFAAGILIAFVILAAGRMTRHAITHRFQPVTVPAHHTSGADHIAGQHFLVDPGSGFAVRVH